MNNSGARRENPRFGGGLVGAALLLALAQLAHAATGDLARIELTDRVSLITGAGSNVVVLETDAGLALVDSGSAEQAGSLLEFIEQEFDGAPVRALFNTHWHEDHTGANELFAGRGARIIAHENTRLWMGTEYYVDWEDRNYEPRPQAAWPTETFFSSDPQPLSFELGGITIEYGHLAEAHTDGDIYVRFPSENLIAVGNVLAVDTFPLFDYSTGGWIGGGQSATQHLLELSDGNTVIVAGEGAAQSRAALQAQAAMLDELRERIRLRIIQGKSVDEILAENVTEGYEALPDPRRFVHNVYQGLWWGGRLRGAY